MSTLRSLGPVNFHGLDYRVRGKAATRFSFPQTEVVNQIRTSSRKHVPHASLQLLENIFHLSQRHALLGVFEAVEC